MTAWQDLAVVENNDVTFHLALTQDDDAFNPTGYTLTVYLKASQTTPDSAATTFTVGNGLTVTSAVLGKVDWTLPHTATGTPGTLWWRIDAVDGSGNRTNLMLGNLNVMAV
jgi:hypothetical protein